MLNERSKMRFIVILLLMLLLIIMSPTNAELLFLDDKEQQTELLFIDKANVGFPLGFNLSICSTLNETVHLFSLALLNNSINVSKANVTENTCAPFSINVFLTNLTEAKIHDVSIVALTATSEKILPVKIKVEENLLWEITSGINATLYNNITKNSFGQFSYSIKNNGNARLNLTVSHSGDDFFYFDRSNAVLSPGENLTKPIYYYFPPNVTTKLYNFNITFVDAFNTFKVYKIFFNITDIYAPDIRIFEISPNETEIGQSVLLRVIVFDDTNVSRVWANLNGTEILFQRTSENIFSYELKDTAIGGERFTTVFVEDMNKNRAAKSATWFVKQKNILTNYNDVNFGKMRARIIKSSKIASLSQPTPISFRLLSFETSRQIRLGVINVTVNGIDIFSAPLQKVDFQDAAGDFIITIRQTILEPLPNTSLNIADYYFDFNGKIRIEVGNDVYNPNPEASFRGAYSQYSVADSLWYNLSFFDFKAGTRLSNFTCYPVDVGNYENSTYDCLSRYPIDVDSDNLAVVASLEAFLAYKNGTEYKIESLTNERNAASSWAWLVSVVFISLLAFVILKEKVLKYFTRL